MKVRYGTKETRGTKEWSKNERDKKVKGNERDENEGMKCDEIRRKRRIGTRMKGTIGTK
jgi:hypothetical protein